MLALRTLLFTVLVPGSVTVVVPYLLLSEAEGSDSHEFGVLRLLGLIPLAIGVAIYLWCAWDFASAGKGTPAPWDAPRALVSRGLYRFTRNPMYLGVGLILMGEAAVFTSPRLVAYAVLIGLLFQLFVVLYEEPTLRRRFGPSYQAYCRAVPRWVPRMPALRRRHRPG